MKVTLSGANVTIAVTDDGIGLSPEAVAGLFEPYQQGASGRENAGLGLGLALVRSVVELHAGNVSITSPGLGAGTTVSIVLPVDDAGRPVEAVRLKAAVPARRILVVEDQPDAAEALRLALTLSGHSVEVARTGADAIELAVRTNPEVIVCDLGLPDLDGYQVARTLRERPWVERIRLIAVSGRATQRDVARAHAAGFDVHLVKPPRLDELERAFTPSAPTDAAAPAERAK